MFPFLWNMSWKTVSCRAQLHTGQPVRFHPLNHQHYDQTTAWTLSGLVLDSLVFSSLKQQNSVVTSSDYAPIPILPGFSQFCLKILNHDQYAIRIGKIPILTPDIFKWILRPVTRILCGGVLTRPKWTKLPKCIFYCLIRLFREVAIHEKL